MNTRAAPALTTGTTTTTTTTIRTPWTESSVTLPPG
jgi:hypothetical protein